MFKKICAATGLTVGAAAGTMLLSTPAHAGDRHEPKPVVPVIIVNHIHNTNNNIAVAVNKTPRPIRERDLEPFTAMTSGEMGR